MKTLAGWLLWFASWVTVGTALRSAANAWAGTHEALWLGAATGAVLGIGTAALLMASKRGWIRGVFRDPVKVEELRKRSHRLNDERSRLIDRAKRR